MADKTQIMKEAQKYLAKGQVDRAIAEWEKLLKEAPDGNVYNIIGDLHLKRGDKKNAMDSLHKAAAYFRNEGFVLKALALYKKVLNLNAADADALFALGELSEEKGLATDATKYYLAAADALSKEGKKDRLLDVYQKILSLSPTNIPLRGKIAEMLLKEGLKSDAMKEYVLIATQYQEKGDSSKAIEYYQKVLDQVPTNRDALLGLSNLHEKTGDAGNAVAYLKEALRQFPEDTDVALRYAGLCFRAGDMPAARSALEKVTTLDPANIGARRLLGDILLREGKREKAWQAFLPVIDEMILGERYDDAVELIEPFRDSEPIETGRRLVSLYRQMGDDTRTAAALVTLGDSLRIRGERDEALNCYRDALQITPDDDQLRDLVEGFEGAGEAPREAPLETPVEEEAPEAEAPSAETIKVVSEGDKSAEDIFLEADIFSRYGLVGEALKLLEGLKSRAPQNMELHTRLKGLYIESGDPEAAVTECLILSELHKRRGEDGEAEAMLTEAMTIAPDDPRLEGRGVASFLEPTSYKQAAPAAEAQEEGEHRIEDYEEEIAEADFYMGQGLLQEATKILLKLHELFPDNRDIGERLSSIGQLADTTGSAEMTGSAGMAGMFEQMEKNMGGTALSEPPVQEEPKPAVVEQSLRSPFREDLEPPVQDQEPEPSFREEELRSSFREDLEPPAQEQEPESSFQGQELKSPFQEQELEPPAQEQTVPGIEETEFEDLSLMTAEDLVDAQEMPEPSLDSDVLEIFQEFKKGLEKELGDEDSETHYNLGIAYKEMGLIDDAIKEFQTSRSDPKRFIQSATLLSVCYMEKGLYPLAIEALEGVLKGLNEQDEAYWSVKYDLAEAHERSGNLPMARQLLTEVYGWNARFRDVTEKLGDINARMPREETLKRPPEQRKERPLEQKKEEPQEQPKTPTKPKKDRVSYL